MQHRDSVMGPSSAPGTAGGSISRVWRLRHHYVGILEQNMMLKMKGNLSKARSHARVYVPSERAEDQDPAWGPRSFGNSEGSAGSNLKQPRLTPVLWMQMGARLLMC